MGEPLNENYYITNLSKIECYYLNSKVVDYTKEFGLYIFGEDSLEDSFNHGRVKHKIISTLKLTDLKSDIDSSRSIRFKSVKLLKQRWNEWKEKIRE